MDKPKVLKLSFNTDYGACQEKAGCGPLGPDGPWQAPIFDVEGGGPQLPLYPSLDFGNVFITADEGGLYDPSVSSTSRKTGLRFLDRQEEVFLGSVINQTSSPMTSYFDNLTFASEPSDDATVNMTVFAASDWKYKTANGSSYSPWVGYLGLGDPFIIVEDKVPSTLLNQVKSQGKIVTEAVSMNLASAKFQQSGSFILGGYDKSRVLGSPGVWSGLPSNSIILRDVTLGVEEGGSPFKIETTVTKAAPLSIWQGLGGNRLGTEITRNCEAIAKHLPLTWRDEIGYYTWNVDDPQYKRIVTSPAYLGFVFSTPEAKNVTIKVAFALLDLTLESPIVSNPTQYFPCHPTDSEYGIWALGRAFLQAAFLGLDYENNQTYIGQGPGPRQEQVLVKEWPKNNNALETSLADSYASTWRPHWSVLPEKGNGSSGSLSGGAIAGIVMGIVGLLAVLTGLAWWLVRKRRNVVHDKDNSEVRHEDKEVVAHGVIQAQEMSGNTMSGMEQQHELPAKQAVFEISG
ncbi:hypothetical protein NLG97_g1774 [Lecanicillium saksenae]|uniref:Uncharacterized protein n=1 Tax=Lecanicillium saksenae TaxID=468837 RepID=A0ACC1R2U1_9HYPO|nr:hypothetical protein NLG97_g1774 [Lecanicillium saksenae]